MQTELKYREKTALKCEQNQNEVLYISNIFEMQMSKNPAENKSFSSIKCTASLSGAEEISINIADNKQQLLISAVSNHSLETQSLWTLCDKTGVLSRRDTLVNQSKAQFTISGAVPSFIFVPGEYEVYSETSEWCLEYQGEGHNVTSDGTTLKNKRGRTTEGGTPYICLREKNTGKGLIFHIIPHGNWIIKINKYTDDCEKSANIVLALGRSDENLNMELAPGARFELPEIMIQALPEKGMEFAAPALHQHVLNNVLNTDVRKTKNRSQPPVVYNTWFDCFDRLEVDRLRKQLAIAKETGCDVFAVDAGWYGGADISWHLQVGDWRENMTKAFKGKMVEFSEEVRNAGLGFGLWMEPERLCENVPILKEHPEWFLSGDDECSYPDLTLSEVYDYTLSAISLLIETYKLSWLKVDFNFTLGIDPSGAEFADYYTKWYQLLDELKEKYPSVFFEGCASGAMRLDLNTLAHFDGHFLSDNTNPWDMLRISQSAFLRLPPGRITRWAVLRDIGKSAPIYGSEITFENRMITPSGNGATWNEFESVGLDFAILAAMPGIFGLSGDISSFSDEQKTKLKKYIDFYKEWRGFISNSSAELLTPVKPIKDRGGWVAFQLTHPDYNESLLFVYRLNGTDDTLSLKLHGINKNKRYILKRVLDDENVNSTLEVSERGDIKIDLPDKNSACCCILR